LVFLPLLIRRFLCCDYRLLLLLLGLGKRRRAVVVVVVVVVVARGRGVVVVGVAVGTRGLLWELKFDHLNDYYLASPLRLVGGGGAVVVVALGAGLSIRFDNGGSKE
jgi:hypothetical protein